MMEHERESWPLLFIYSKNGDIYNLRCSNKHVIYKSFSDKLLKWRYVDEVVRVQTLTGRPVLSKMFNKSGSAGHVAHLKYHPMEYREMVQRLLEIV